MGMGMGTEGFRMRSRSRRRTSSAKHPHRPCTEHTLTCVHPCTSTIQHAPPLSLLGPDNKGLPQLQGHKDTLTPLHYQAQCNTGSNQGSFYSVSKATLWSKEMDRLQYYIVKVLHKVLYLRRTQMDSKKKKN
jgi:hypothetical protein